MQRLIVNPGMESTWEIPLRTGIATLGREEGNDFVIDHPSVSGQHCEFMVMDSSVTVKDLGSFNGTFIDGQAVNESILLPGQTLQVGEVRLQLEQVAAPAAAATATSHAHCKFHPRNPARYLCPKCHGNFCEMCVSTRSTGGHFCRTCVVECSPLTPAAVADDATELSFTRQAIGAFKYPLNSDGIILIVTGTIFFLLLDGARMLSKFAFVYGWLALILLTVFGTGYLTAYLRLNLNATAMGEDKMPDWPEMSDVVSPFWQLLVTVLFCFAPAIGLTIYAAVSSGDGDTAWLGWVTTASLLLGCVYFPMAFTAVAMFDSVGAVNPLLIIPSIAKVLKEYVLTVVMLAVILVARWLMKNYLATILPVPLLPTIISSLVGLYLLIVEMRILGLLYRNKKYELGWFT
ncbi:MAG: FHA domain-containing protein [Verrucomicrobiales bacterium]|nr:FHA domain-containing protein [Verrucomicrobiales bacterium]